jgi:hypothetical protein
MGVTSAWTLATSREREATRAMVDEGNMMMIDDYRN